jgi:dienelactone hydrolase
VLVVDIVAILATRWTAIRSSHPAYLVALLLALVGALVIIGRQVLVRPLAETDGTSRAHTEAPTGAALQPRPRAWLRTSLSVTGSIAILLLAGVLWYLRPLPASDAAVQSMRGTDQVTVTDTTTRILVEPSNGAASDTGMILYPGALVEPRAYAPIVTPIAADGFTVVILKLPFNIAFFDPNGAVAVMDANPDITTWVVAGHSLGGVLASSVAARDERVGGLLLWASYPNSAIPPRDTLLVTSIFGLNDALATPAKIDNNRELLPADTDYVEIVGGIHSFFGDYGLQAGDGEPEISRVEAQEQISAASLDLLRSVDARS